MWLNSSVFATHAVPSLQSCLERKMCGDMRMYRNVLPGWFYSDADPRQWKSKLSFIIGVSESSSQSYIAKMDVTILMQPYACILTCQKLTVKEKMGYYWMGWFNFLNRAHTFAARRVGLMKTESNYCLILPHLTHPGDWPGGTGR